ncbi:MAG: repeat-containing protein [Mucilaginibacter sp.]|nr:repeat-containing protein [Mucilaginibacter sp.]
MKIILILILSFSLFNSFSQTTKKEEHILYIIDSVPIINDPDEDMGVLKNEDIDNLKVVTDQDKIKELGYTSTDKVIFITTKVYLKRSDEIKKIPTTKVMEKRNGKWYLKDSSIPYSGRFIDYFLNGNIQGEGIFKEGIVNGLRVIYYQNGNKSYFRNYVNGIAEGYSEEYFLNGNIKQKGSFKNGKDDGLWTDFYSTGDIKRQSTFVNEKPNLSKEEKGFYDLQNKAIELMKANDYSGAIKKLDQAEKLNNKYADIYFYRGTSKLDEFDFDNAIIDFDKAIALEPLYEEALANRAFTRIRKYEFKNSRSLSKTSEVTILAVKDKVEIPEVEKSKIRNDLSKCVELGSNKQMILDAIDKYCK